MDSNLIITILDAANQARSQSYAPYSKFFVGCAIILNDGSIYTGANIENASYSATICAERVALPMVISKGLQEQIMALAVVTDTTEPTSPCGVCRQFLSEFLLEDTPIIIGNSNKNYIITNIKELLPMAFTKKALIN